MQKVLDKQELLWFVVEEIYAKQIDKNNKIIFKQAEFVLKFNLNEELAKQLDMEVSAIYNALQDLIEKDYNNQISEVAETEEDMINLIYHTISLGKETVTKILNKEINLIKYYKKNKYNDSFNYVLPYAHDYGNSILESIKIEEKSYNKKIKILNESKYLHPDYVNQVIEETKYFTNFIEKIKKEKNINFNKKEYNDKFDKFQKLYIHASDYIARINNKSSNDGGNMLIGYFYENTINEYINERKYKNKKYDLSKFNKDYIAEYKNPTIKVVRNF